MKIHQWNILRYVYTFECAKKGQADRYLLETKASQNALHGQISEVKMTEY